MRRVSAGLVMRAVTSSLQSGLDHLGGNQRVVLAALQSPQLLPGRGQLLHHFLQALANLGVSRLAAADPLPDNILHKYWQNNSPVNCKVFQFSVA